MLNIKFFDLLKQSIDNVYDFFLGYNSLRIGLQSDVVVLSNKYNSICFSDDDFLKNTLPKVIDFSKDILDSIKKYSTKTYDLIKRKKTLKTTKTAESLEKIVEDVEGKEDNSCVDEFKTYTSSINYVKKSNIKYKDISNILLGDARDDGNKRAWAWVDREKLLDEYISKNILSYKDKESVERLKQAIKKNNYLKYKKKKTYKRLKKKLRKIVADSPDSKNYSDNNHG